MARTKIVRVPMEFDFMIDRLSSEMSKETGYAKNKMATMKKLAELDGKLIFKNNKIDWRLI